MTPIIRQSRKALIRVIARMAGKVRQAQLVVNSVEGGRSLKNPPAGRKWVRGRAQEGKEPA